MKVEVIIREARHPLTPAGSFATAECVCPSCGYSLDVVGKARRTVGDVHVADAYCVRCHDLVGVVEARPESIFGAAEDRAVLAEVEPRGGRVYQ